MQLTRGSWLSKADPAIGSYLPRPTALWEETVGDPRRDGALGAEQRGSQGFTSLPGRPQSAGHQQSQGPRLFLGCFLGNTGATQPCPAQAWAQGPPAAPLHSTPTSLA